MGWTGDQPKEAIEIDGTPIIVRTVRLLREYGVDPVVITHKEAVISAVWREARYSSVRAPCFAASVMMQTWGEYNAVFLGDVYYSEKAVHRIFSVYNFAYGNEEAIVAMRWTSKEHDSVTKAFDNVVGYFMQGKGRGTIQQVFNSYSGFLLSDMNKIGRNLTLIEDETTDFDTVQKYEDWLRQYRGTDGRPLDESS